MVTKTCNTCNLTLDISEFYKNYVKCKKCRKKAQKLRHFEGSYTCEHQKIKYNCILCSPELFCKHKKEKRLCKKCGGKRICEHGIFKPQCKQCGGSQVCPHNKLKHNCHVCGGKGLCIHCKFTKGRLRYVKSIDKKVRCCAGCFYNSYPNDKIPRRFKSKQHYFNKKLIEEFGDIFEYDKAIKCGCSLKRPDWFVDCFNYSIIIELDENQHKYNSCDEKRMMQLFQDLGNRKLVLIRINPDKYKKGDIKISNCFKFDKNNTIKCVTKEFNERYNKLVERIQHFLNNEPTKELTIEKLFFDY
jgi:hypothetical protein